MARNYLYNIVGQPHVWHANPLRSSWDLWSNVSFRIKEFFDNFRNRERVVAWSVLLPRKITRKDDHQIFSVELCKLDLIISTNPSSKPPSASPPVSQEPLRQMIPLRHNKKAIIYQR
jgi:hypothetical protein